MHVFALLYMVSVHRQILKKCLIKALDGFSKLDGGLEYTLFIYFYPQTEVCKWTQVQFQGSPVDWKLKPLEKKVVCPPLKPGECGNISITFIAPG